MTRLANAPAKTVSRGCRLARMAAMRNVLSPISDTTWRFGQRDEVSRLGAAKRVKESARGRMHDHDESLPEGS
jgi:hypothetical protein